MLVIEGNVQRFTLRAFLEPLIEVRAVKEYTTKLDRVCPTYGLTYPPLLSIMPASPLNLARGRKTGFPSLSGSI